MRILLLNVRNKYSPGRIRDLKPDSEDEHLLHRVNASFFELINLSGRIELFELLAVPLREDLTFLRRPGLQAVHNRLQRFIEQFLVENYVSLEEARQLESLEWVVARFFNAELDHSLIENQRFASVRKILLLLLENTAPGALIRFLENCHAAFERSFESLLDRLAQKSISPDSPQGVKQTLHLLCEQTCVFNILESLYKRLTTTQIRQFHEKVTPSPPENLWKKKNKRFYLL